MLMMPKGYEFWIKGDNGVNVISPDAPEWAKKEFEKYQNMLESCNIPDKDGIIKQ